MADKDESRMLSAPAYRANMYRIASNAFLEEPSEDLLCQLVALSQGTTDEGFATMCERELVRSLGALAESDMGVLRTRIASEYAELFIGPRPPRAPLYESVYVGRGHRLFTGVTESVRMFYERSGLTAIRRNRVPDDHIGYELEFMSHLCAREAASGSEDGIASVRATPASFLLMHLASWSHAFYERIAEAGCSAYYQAWARFVDVFANEDLAVLLAERSHY